MQKLIFQWMGILVCCFELTHPISVSAAEPKKVEAQGAAISVDALKKDYWEMGDESSVYRVVQQRSFVKKGKLEFGLLGGLISSDPFVSDNSAGGMLGYYVSESIQLNLIGWKDFAGASDAKTTLIAAGSTTNSNTPLFFAGGGMEYSPIYGKISLFGTKIIHYDLHLSAIIGCRGIQAYQTNTLLFTGMVGIGQIFFVSQHVGLRLDYKMSFYSEPVFEQVIAPLGVFKNNRLNRGDIITLGLSVFL